jgi:hypothetical protein
VGAQKCDTFSVISCACTESAEAASAADIKLNVDFKTCFTKDSFDCKK